MTTSEDWKAFFEAQVREAFDYLCVRFGFRYCQADVLAPECWAAYENETTRVTIAFELGSGPRVEFERIKTNLFGLRKDRFDLAFLLMERAPDEYVRSEIVDLDDPRLRSELRRLSKLLERHGEDILRGDFSVFPRLRERAKENLKRTNRELYGQ